MRLSSLLLATAVVSMAAVPAFAGPANPAASLSLAGSDAKAGTTVRASAPMKRSNRLTSTATIVIAGLAVAGVIAGAVALSHHDNKPASA